MHPPPSPPVVRLHVRDNQTLLVGRLESDGTLALGFMQAKTTAATPTPSTFKTKDTTFKTKDAKSFPFSDSNSLWIVERARAAVGGPCRWHHRFRLLHLNTGKFLSIGHDASFGQTQVVCNSDDRDRATLFSFKKLKNEITGKADGSHGVIFANRPFLICKDATANSPSNKRGGAAANPPAKSAKANAAESAACPDMSGCWWLSSSDEPTRDESAEAGGTDEVMFAVRATRQKRIQVRVRLDIE